MNARNNFARCSQDFSTSWRTVNILPFPEAALGFWELFLSKVLQSLLATTFPTTSNRVMPLQLSHLLRSALVEIGTSSASDQFFDTSLFSHVVCTRNLRKITQHVALTISGRMPAFPFLSFPITSVSSSIVDR